MIKSKADLKRYMAEDMDFYHHYTRWDRFVLRLVQDPACRIAQYLRCLRKEEYYFNVRRTKLDTLLYLYWFRRKNRIGNQLGLKIPKNCFGPGLSIYHHGCVIVNEAACIGANCQLHGNNCIGNKGSGDLVPVIGDGLDLGFGACVIGDVTLGNNIVVGTNAVVVKSVEEDAVTLAGVPAKTIKV